MSTIKYLANEKIFKLDTPGSSYVFGIIDEEKFLLHMYYGGRISDDDIRYRTRTNDYPFTPEKNNRDRGAFLDSAYFEYPTEGVGDFRAGCLRLRDNDGHAGCQLSYVNHKIYKGKPGLEGLPATYVADANDATTLKVRLEDKLTGLIVTLNYTVFEDLDVIARSVGFENAGRDTLYLESALSLCLDMENEDFEIITLNGSWARERHTDRTRIGYGRHEVSSTRGESSHQVNPFMAVLNRETTQTLGAVYGFSFVYSGNFTASVERNQHDSLRCLMGINPKGFTWKLTPGETFTAPEAVMVYSGSGLDHMTHTFHDLFRDHLICGANLSSRYKDAPRPILINNWEATYFDFDDEKLLSIAKEAAKCGIEMLVMDDGWFANRSSDNMALGDWYVNEDKLKGGLKKLVDAVNNEGLKFGIWVEPEMVSPDSDLYRKHSDWAIAIPGRPATLMRNQYVLDMSRDEVAEEIYSRIHAVLSSANIEYVKWDMNRTLCDLGSYALDSDRQGELCHRYMLNVYKMQKRLMDDFPNILLENCSGGGGRFDPGMLYYGPQIWCSDDTDAIERLRIQEGTAIVYPLSTMGAHVSDCPNHVTGRIAPFETRGHVALAGTFGYELDITKISETDRALIPAQVEMYHKYNELVRAGDYYRLASYADNGFYDAWEVVNKEESHALVTYIKVMARPYTRSNVIKPRGLDPKRRYMVSCDKNILGLAGDSYKPLILHGDTLMNAGIMINENAEEMKGDFRSALIEISAV